MRVILSKYTTNGTKTQNIKVGLKFDSKCETLYKEAFDEEGAKDLSTLSKTMFVREELKEEEGIVLEPLSFFGVSVVVAIGSVINPTAELERIEKKVCCCCF